MPNDVLDKIRKLLALARDASATPGEVEAALGRAAHLQRLHGITEEQVRKHVHRDHRGEVHIHADAVERRTIYTAKRLGRWQVWTASAMAKAAGCAVYLSHGSGGSIVAYGLPADLAVCQELFTFGIETGERLQREWCRRESLQPSSREGKSWRDGFCRGLGDAAADCAVEASKADLTSVPTGLLEQVKDATPGTMAVACIPAGALVFAKQTALQTFARTRLNLGSGRGYRGTAGGSASGYAAGRATGSAQNLTRRAVR